MKTTETTTTTATTKKLTLKETAEASQSVLLGLVTFSNKGVTNKQMIPALQANQDNNENLQLLFNEFKEVFMATAKYTPDITKAYVETFVKSQAGHETFEVVPMGKKVRVLLNEGVAPSDIAAKLAEVKAPKTEKVEVTPAAPEFTIAETFKSEHNEKIANLVTGKNDWKTVLSEEQIQMVMLAVQDASVSEIATQLGMSGDKVRGQLYKNATSIANLLTA